MCPMQEGYALDHSETQDWRSMLNRTWTCEDFFMFHPSEEFDSQVKQPISLLEETFVHSWRLCLELLNFLLTKSEGFHRRFSREYIPKGNEIHV